ncbi:DUF4349 domain-containing protein [Nocardioides insulae]|uniref:DUF4349 domain-containing protein n=1 Tax=Nocardioides insulae TaxID=394734 RepID=UPI0004121C9E|nr:DUF4349 domain-containing protein [Nocardioides insulae]
MTVLGWVALVVILVVLAGCGGSDGSADTGDSGGSTSVPDSAVAADEAAGGRAATGKSDSPRAPGSETGEDIAALARSSVQNADLIKTATMELSSEDVAADHAEVVRVVESHGGFVADQEAYRDQDGRASDARLQLRVPVDEFDDTVAALEQIATPTSSTISTQDVTAQLTDTRVRIAAQRASLARVRALLDRAESIEDIVAIESELTRRQADLDSLLRTQARLADQTEYSTVSVSITRAWAEPAPEDEQSGFLSGLDTGWHAMLTFITGVGVAAGLLLPWLGLLALVAVPALWFLRRRAPRSDPPSE